MDGKLCSSGEGGTEVRIACIYMYVWLCHDCGCVSGTIVVLSIFDFVIIRFYTFSDGTSKAKEGLPHKCLTACSFAISQLTAVSQQLQEGDITVMELQKIVAKEEHMKRLCNAASAEPKNKNRSHVQVLTGTLQLRLHECKSFKEQQGFLLHLCQRIHPQIEGQQSAARCSLSLI